MKKLLLFVGLCAATLAHAQTATNFIATDCSGNQHNLFSELDSGKVIILVWVMPCGGCVGAAQTAANIAEDFAATDSGRVFCYIADDYGDASCLTINSWVTNNNIARVTTFSDSAIDMSAYGANGMPKVVVLGGGSSHGVYFNQDNQFADDSIGIKIAVDSALADANGILNLPIVNWSTVLYPNPASGHVTLIVPSPTYESGSIQVITSDGKLVQHTWCIFQEGENRVELELPYYLPTGTYYVRIFTSLGVEVLKFDYVGRKF